MSENKTQNRAKMKIELSEHANKIDVVKYNVFFGGFFLLLLWPTSFLQIIM